MEVDVEQKYHDAALLIADAADAKGSKCFQCELGIFLSYLYVMGLEEGEEATMMGAASFMGHIAKTMIGITQEFSKAKEAEEAAEKVLH